MPIDNNRRRRRRTTTYSPRPTYKKGLSFVQVVVISLIALIAILASLLIFLPSFAQIPFYTYHKELDENVIHVIKGDGEITTDKQGNQLQITSNNNTVDGYTPPIIKNDMLYLPVDFVNKVIDPYVFWEKESNKLTITTENTVMQMKTDDLTYYVNHEPLILNIPVHNIDNMAYMPQTMLENLYPSYSYTYIEDYNFLILKDLTVSENKGTITKKDVPIRYLPNKKSPYMDKLALNSTVTVFETTEKYTKIRTENGLIGYVLTKNIGNITSTNTVPDTNLIDQLAGTNTTQELKKIDGKINMVWDQVTTVEANNNPLRKELIEGLNVLSPTWFSFDEELLNGDIINIADKQYVDFAHQNGYQVWALITDNFNKEVSHSVLSTPEAREHVIKQLLAFISMYDLDGINIDFEQVPAEDADYWLEFLRELSPMMKAQGAYLSVDLYVPSPWSKFYNREEVAKVVDYICVMSYDENTSSTGPVASLGFVDASMNDTIAEGVPKEKIIMGLPFYVRVWEERVGEDGTITYDKRNYSMETAANIFKENNATYTWDEATGYDYVEYQNTDENGEIVTYKCWVENTKSISLKLDIFEKYEVAGVSGWKRGLEYPEVWDLINESLGKK